MVKQFFWWVVFFSFSIYSVTCVAQETALTGILLHEVTSQPVAGAVITAEGTTILDFSDTDGSFTLKDLKIGEQYILAIEKVGFLTRRFPVRIDGGSPRDVGPVFLEPDFLQDQQRSEFITLSSLELDSDEGEYENISGLLQATKDVFLNAAAFDFSPTFFRPRGLGSEYGSLMINGVEMNKLHNGRPQWSNWGGLNDVQRNQVFSPGLSPSEVTFGGPAGTTNIIMRAGAYSRGGKTSYAVSNRAYSGRLMSSYSSGMTHNGWAYSVALSRRFAEESFVEGSIYDANSLFGAVEKKISDVHSLNFTGIYTPNRRGKTSPNTMEVYDLKGNRYNSYWGYQEGEMRNSRMRITEEPILMLNHLWKLSPTTHLTTNAAYQFGKVGNSRIDYGGSRILSTGDGQTTFVGGGSNPDPAYYQKLPGYFLRYYNSQNFQAAYLAQKEFQEYGQLDWNSLYAANRLVSDARGNSLYVLYEDRNDDQQFTGNSIMRSQLSKHAVLNASVSFRNLRSENYARTLDLLGGTFFLDVDPFSRGDQAQNNLEDPNRLVGEGDIFKYHFLIDARVTDAFVQTQFRFRKYEWYAASNISHTGYSRTGLFKNGNFPDNSLGKSETLDFANYGFKSGVTYKLSGKHVLDVNSGYLTKAPAIRNSFSNSRQNNNLVRNLESEKIGSLDGSYIFRSGKVKGRLTGYYTSITDGTEVSFFFADGISGLESNETTAFVQEILSGIGKQHLGTELGMEAQILPFLKLKGVAALGQFTYSTNPGLYLTSDDFTGEIDYGIAHLKNYRIAGGPQRAYQLGFEYRDPSYWWFSATGNIFSHAFIDVAPLTRTQNFFTDADGLPILSYDRETARNLLRQEQFDSYFLVNTVGGKSWRVKNYFIGIFGSVNNILNQAYKTGGFEQARNANYKTLKADMEREIPVFGNKYWFGPGTTYYSHLYIRF